MTFFEQKQHITMKIEQTILTLFRSPDKMSFLITPPDFTH